MEKDNHADTGARVRSLRGEMTQKEFADLLGVSTKTITRYESGERLPDAEFLIKLNVLYKAQPLWVLVGKGESTVGEQLTTREALLLNYFRCADEAGKKAIEATSALLAVKK